MPPDDPRSDPPPVPAVLRPGASEDPTFDASTADEHAHTVEEAKAVTRQRARDFGVLLARTFRRHLPQRQPSARAATPPPPKLAGRLAQVLPVMRTIPWVLGAFFALSFVWDFPGQTVTLFGQVLAVEGLLRILSVSGLIGFGTNWLAITMLFQPRQKRPIVPQGLIPAQRERVIYRLAQAISQELINETIIKEKIEASGVIPRYREQAVGVLKAVVEDEEFRSDLKALTADYFETVLGSEDMRRKLAALAAEKIQQQAGQGLGGLALRAYRLVNEADFQRRIDQAIKELPAALDPVLDRLDHALDRVPGLVETRSEDIERIATKTVLGFVERLDVYEMIVENARRFDESQLEDLLKRTSNEQLNYIKYLGGILGVVGGFVIWEPLLALAVLTALALALWGADEALYRMRDQPAQNT
jgi:uncharacterized membrane-anchored protein YjiN (DUF445 family)